MSIRTRRRPANRMLISRPGWMGTETVVHEVQLPEDVSQEQFEADLQAWLTGALIQDSIGYLHPEDREFIKTGATPQVWSEIFGSEEEIWNAGAEAASV
jgi:hypothetical protein